MVMARLPHLIITLLLLAINLLNRYNEIYTYKCPIMSLSLSLIPCLLLFVSIHQKVLIAIEKST